MKINSSWAIGVAIVLSLLTSAIARADGGYFGRSVAISADQRAIIIKDGDRVSMTFSTGYTGEGDDFAWIIPVPKAPKPEDVIEGGEAADSAFTILDQMTAPEVFIFPHGRHTGCGVLHFSAGSEAPMTLVKIYGQVKLEHYEASILGAEKAAALLDWLQEHGYKVDPKAAAVLQSYIDQRWAFVAVKLNPSEKRHYENEFLAPLTIRFEAKDLVFPLRISAVSTRSVVRITLFVIAESTVSSPNYPTRELQYEPHPSELPDPEAYLEQCLLDTIGAGGRGLVVINRSEFYLSGVEYPYPILIGKRLADNKKYFVTRLETRLSPELMRDDIQLTPDSSHREFQVYIQIRPDYGHHSSRWPGYFAAVMLGLIGLGPGKDKRSLYLAAALMLMVLVV